MKTMTNKMFRRNFNNLPIGAKVLWYISATIASVAIVMIGLEFFGKIGDHHLLEIMLCNVSLFSNICYAIRNYYTS